MAPVLEAMLPRLVPEGCVFRIVPHQGARDLERSLPKRLKAWRDPYARFLVLRDNDAGDCRERKDRLMRICKAAGKGDRALVRIVCQELEAWFLADPVAVEHARLGEGGGLAERISEKFPDPDAVTSPLRAMSELFGHYGKITGARAIAPHLDIDRNRSRSFRHFVEAVRRLSVA